MKYFPVLMIVIVLMFFGRRQPPLSAKPPSAVNQEIDPLLKRAHWRFV